MSPLAPDLFEDAPGRVMFSTAEDGFDLAVQELHNAFGRDVPITPIGPDVGLISAPVAQVVDACRERPLAFVKHLSVVQEMIERAQVEPERLVGSGVGVVLEYPDIEGLSVQAWASGSPRLGFGAGELAGLIGTQLSARGLRVSRGGEEVVLSCCLTPDAALIGLNELDLSLSDWPGGRVRLGKAPEQISRAEFKLEELFGLFPIDLPDGGRAIDLGAAPGGWTRILRNRGQQVWAVDPGDLDERLLGDPDVHHARTTAGQFLRSAPGTFDVIVNDMKMDPRTSCTVTADFADLLRPGAYAIVTLKLGSRGPVPEMNNALDILRARYDVIFARRLHHNRHEVTVVGRLRR